MRLGFWKTQRKTRGPYYKPIKWAGLADIESAFLARAKVHPKNAYIFSLTSMTESGSPQGPDDTNLSPFKGKIGSMMNEKQFANALLRSSHTVSQGFRTTLFVMNDNSGYLSFITSTTSYEIKIRDIDGKASALEINNINQEIELPTSITPPELANSISLEEFATLVKFLGA